MKIVKFILGIIVVIAIVAVVLFVGRGCRGDGGGPGLGSPVATTGNPIVEQDSPEPSLPQAPETTPANATGNGEETTNPNIVSVRIEEDHVYVNGEEIPDAEALRRYIEEINDDEKIFELTEDETRSILATHKWVHDVFDELEIPLIPAAE